MSNTLEEMALDIMSKHTLETISADEARTLKSAWFKKFGYDEEIDLCMCKKENYAKVYKKWQSYLNDKGTVR